MAVVVLDFDGTLADSLVVLLEVYNELAEAKGFQHVNEADWRRLREGTIKDGLKWTGVKAFQVPSLLTQGLKLLEKRKAEIKLFPEMIKVVQQLHKDGHTLFVLSTNSQELIQEVLNKHGIGSELEVLKSSRIFGKAQALRKLVRTNNFNEDDVWMIGDEVRDMNGAKRAAVHGIGVSWGFQPPRTLQAVSPSVQIAKTPTDIIKIIDAWGR